MTHIERPEALRYELVRLHKEARQPYPRQSHHAGDAESCLRQLAYKWQNVPQDNQPFADSMAGDMGTATEEFVNSLLETNLIMTSERNVRITVAVAVHELHGKIDFVLVFEPEAWKKFFPQYKQQAIPLEVKSVTTKRYADQVVSGPYQAHVGQLNIYTCATEAPFGLLMYVQREATEEIPFSIWLVRADRVRYNRVRKRLAKLDSYLTLDIVPPPLCEEGKLDKNCPWMKVRCPADGGWPSKHCKVCGDPVTDMAEHADCVFGSG